MLGDWDVSDVLGREDEDMVFTTDWARSSFEVDLLHATQEQDVPRSFAQVMKLSPEARIPWIEACRAQCRSFLAIPAISGVLRPDQWTKAPPIRLSWVLTTKPPLDEPKARIVMLGQHMREGVHFNDTHAPVASVTCVRVLLDITAAAGRLLTQFDVKAAFLTAPLDIELDVILPDGFGIGSDDGQFSSPEGRRRRALTAIPGCPQGSRVWREKLVQVLASLGFKPFLPDEPCLFKDSGSDPIYLLTWVDDFVSSSPATPDGKKREDALKKGLRRCFPHGLKISPPGSKMWLCPRKAVSGRNIFPSEAVHRTAPA